MPGPPVRCPQAEGPERDDKGTFSTRESLVSSGRKLSEPRPTAVSNSLSPGPLPASAPLPSSIKSVPHSPLTHKASPETRTEPPTLTPKVASKGHCAKQGRKLRDMRLLPDDRQPSSPSDPHKGNVTPCQGHWPNDWSKVWKWSRTPWGPPGTQALPCPPFLLVEKGFRFLGLPRVPKRRLKRLLVREVRELQK